MALPGTEPDHRRARSRDRRRRGARALGRAHHRGLRARGRPRGAGRARRDHERAERGRERAPAAGRDAGDRARRTFSRRSASSRVAAAPAIPDVGRRGAVLDALADGAATADELVACDRAVGGRGRRGAGRARARRRRSTVGRREWCAVRSPGDAVLARRAGSRARRVAAAAPSTSGSSARGITGCACALALAEAGLRVRVVDERRVAEGASGRNGGFALRGMAGALRQVVADHGRGAGARAVALDRGRARRDGTRWRATAFRPLGSLRLAADGEEREDLRDEIEALWADGFEAEWLDAPDGPARGTLHGRDPPPDRRRAAAGPLRAARSPRSPPRPASRSSSTTRERPVRARRRDRRGRDRRLSERPPRRARGPDRADARSGDRDRAAPRAAVRGAALRAPRLRLLAPGRGRPHRRRRLPRRRRSTRSSPTRRRSPTTSRRRWRRSSTASSVARSGSTTAGRGSSGSCSTSCRGRARCPARRRLGRRRLLGPRQRARVRVRPTWSARAILGDRDPLLDLFEPARLLGV